MAWSDLKAAIAAIVKTNGNNEITGALLQQVLNSIVDNVGENSAYKGLAVPTTSPGTPDGPQFYLAYAQGTYSNFNGQEISNPGIYVFNWTGSAWTYTKIVDLYTETKKYIAPANRCGVEWMNFVKSDGTQITDNVPGIYSWDAGYDTDPGYIGWYITYYYEADYTPNEGNYGPYRIYVKGAQGANNGYRSILIVDENDRHVYQTNRSGDFTFIIYHGWRIKATCLEMYVGPSMGRVSEYINDHESRILTNEMMLTQFPGSYIKTQMLSTGIANGTGGTTSAIAFQFDGKTYGLRQTTDVTSTGYSYAYAKYANDYADVSTQKIKVVIKSDVAGSFRLKGVNGSSSLGGGDAGAGTLIGVFLSQTVTFAESNNLTAVVEIDMSAQTIADFYADPDRANQQLVTFILTANEGASTAIGTYVLDWYFYDSTQDLGEYLEDPYLESYATKEWVENAIILYAENELPELYQETTYLPLNSENFTLRGGSLVTIDEIKNYRFNLVKELGLPDSYVCGLYIKFEYADLTELDKELTIILDKQSGDSLESFYILDNVGDWDPGSKRIGIGGSISDGINKINLYELIMANETYRDYYLGATQLQVLLARFDGFDPSSLEDIEFDYLIDLYYKKDDVLCIASDLTEAVKAILTEETKDAVITELGLPDTNTIVCWGDSLTAGGGWTTTLGALAGMTVYNGGTGGEKSDTILARQGGDVMIANNITIPATTTQVLIADRDVDGGIPTQFGRIATPLLQGGAHVNPCFIGDIQGTLAWTGVDYADLTGDWVFTRTTAGDETVIDRPTAIRTDFDINKNNPYLMVIFIGQNGGYDSDNDYLVWQHKKMIEHANPKHVICLGLSSGTAASRADYETKMRDEFGRYFISLREYLSAPIYDVDEVTIISSYGLDDAGLTPTQADLDAIAIGQTPPQLLSDGTHYTTETKTVIGNMLYKRCVDMNIF